MRTITVLTFSLACLLFSVLPIAEARRPIQKIKVQAELRAELNAILKAAVSLQEASFKRNDRATSLAAKNLVKRLVSAEKKSGLAKEQKTHLVKILSAAKSHLERSRRSAGSDRQTYYQKTFHQLVLIAQVYQLEPYKIFFCPKDKSVWLQKGSKPQNPINPETYGNCGKLAT
ncbi:MAG: hypothetical protein AB7N80_14990 [Bdellovibrionales bacterium]